LAQLYDHLHADFGEQVECTVDNTFNLRDLVLQELVKIIVDF